MSWHTSLHSVLVSWHTSKHSVLVRAVVRHQVCRWCRSWPHIIDGQLHHKYPTKPPTSHSHTHSIKCRQIPNEILTFSLQPFFPRHPLPNLLKIFPPRKYSFCPSSWRRRVDFGAGWKHDRMLLRTKHKTGKPTSQKAWKSHFQEIGDHVLAQSFISYFDVFCPKPQNSILSLRVRKMYHCEAATPRRHPMK